MKLPVSTERDLTIMMNIVFEHAISSPLHSPTFASLAQILAQVTCYTVYRPSATVQFSGNILKIDAVKI